MNKVTGNLQWTRLAVLSATLIAGMVVLLALHSPSPAYAYIDELAIECNEDPVEEGDTYRLHILNDSDNYGIVVTFNIDQTMKVYWFTEEGTASEEDYSPLNNEGQASNRSQSDDGRMGRTFYTKEDLFSEDTESFTVRADNASDDGTGAGSCTIEIEDDDGPGAVSTWIVYDPEDSSEGFTVGERILIAQRFNRDVEVKGGRVGLGLNIGQGEEVVRRSARYKGGGTFPSWLLFEYRVTGEDLDLDGISIPGSDYDGKGRIVTKWTNQEVNSNYQEVTYGNDFKVSGRAYTKNLRITSTPANGEKYRAGEAIEIRAHFNRAVAVSEEGVSALRLRVGETDDWVVDAQYNRGSGSNNLVFRYEVPGGAFDFDGVNVEPGYTDDEGTIHGLASEGYVTDVDNGHTVSATYDGLEEQAGHKVDGRPYITGVSLSSTPANGVAYRYREHIEIELDFDQEVSVYGQPKITVWIGQGADGRQELAKYSSGSLTETLTFKYSVEEDDLDDNGVSVTERTGFLGNGQVLIANGNRLADDFIPGLTNQGEHKIDGRLPYIVGSSMTSNPATGEVYKKGESIAVSLTFDKEVDVLGRPSIRLLLGDNGRRRDATYSSGASTDTLVFAYEVQTGDRDDDGVALMARGSNGIDGPYRVYEKGTENKVKATIAGIDDQSEHKVDGRPYVVAVTIASSPLRNGVYRSGEAIELSLEFDRKVEVEGTPSVELLVGEEDGEREAGYVGGSGTKVLTFAYQVQDDDMDSDGISQTARESGAFGSEGTITASETEVEADDAIPGIENQADHAVAGKVRIESVAVDSDPGNDETYENGDTVQVSVRFEDEVTVSGTPQLALDFDGDAKIADFRTARPPAEESGDPGSDLDTAVATGEVLVFTYIVQEGDEDVDGIAIGENALSLNGGAVTDPNGTGPNGTGPNGNEANLDHDGVAFEGHLVGAIPPVLDSARTSEDGNEVIVSFSQRVHIRPEIRTLSAFAGVDVGIFLQTLVDIFVDDHRPHITAAALSAKELTLTMDTPITEGETVEVAYDNVFAGDVAGLLIDDAGNALAPFSAQTITNDSTLPDNENALWPMVSSDSLTVEEGGSNTYTITLGSQPAEDVTVSLSLSPTGHLTAGPLELSFTPENWDTPQTITLTAGWDDDELNFWLEIIHTSDAEDFIAGHLKVLVEDLGVSGP